MRAQAPHCVQTASFVTGTILTGCFFMRRRYDSTKAMKRSLLSQLLGGHFSCEQSTARGSECCSIFSRIAKPKFRASFKSLWFGASGCNGTFGRAVRVFTHVCSRTHHAKSAFLQEISQLSGGMTKVAVAIEHNRYSRRVVAPQLV